MLDTELHNHLPHVPPFLFLFFPLTTRSNHELLYILTCKRNPPDNSRLSKYHNQVDLRFFEFSESTESASTGSSRHIRDLLYILELVLTVFVIEATVVRQ